MQVQLLLLLVVAARSRRMRLRQWVGAARRAAHGGGGLEAQTAAGLGFASGQELRCVLQAAVSRGGFWRALCFHHLGPICLNVVSFSTDIMNSFARRVWLMCGFGVVD